MEQAPHLHLSNAPTLLRQNSCGHFESVCNYLSSYDFLVLFLTSCDSFCSFWLFIAVLCSSVEVFIDYPIRGTNSHFLQRFWSGGHLLQTNHDTKKPTTYQPLTLLGGTLEGPYPHTVIEFKAVHVCCSSDAPRWQELEQVDLHWWLHKHKIVFCHTETAEG